MSESKYPFSREEILKTVTEETSKLREGGVYATYSRLSHFDEDDRGYSIDIQPDRSEEFARSEKASEIRVYSDPGRSGKNSKRPGLQRLIRDVKAGRIDVVVFHRVDRIFRNLKSLLEFVDLLKKYNVRLVSVTEKIDTDKWWGRLVLAVLGSLAEAYLWQTSANITEALGKRRSKGNHLGRIPLGYCNGLCRTCNDENGKGYCPLYGGNDRPESMRGTIAVPHPIDRYVIPLIHDLYVVIKMSFREIADYLNNNCVTLPDGFKVLFRPRGARQNKLKSPDFQPTFNRESIRAIIENPFYTGQVARYRRPKFSLEDNLENPESIQTPKIEGDSREVLELFSGLHEPLISFETWKAAQSLRKQKGSTPGAANKAVRIYPLTGVARCWECFHELNQEFTLRGSMGGKGIKYYRCAYTHDRSSKRKRRNAPRLEGVNPVINSINDSLLSKHRTLRADRLESQVDLLVSRMTIPQSLDIWIAAYYLSKDGMAEFERAGYGYRQDLKKVQKLYVADQIAQPEFERRTRILQEKLNASLPTAHPDAARVLGEYRSFAKVWRQLDDGQKRTILDIMFAALYFDHNGKLIRAVAYEPFREAMGLPQDGVIEQV